MQRNWFFVTISDFLVATSLQPNLTSISNYKLCWMKSSKFEMSKVLQFAKSYIVSYTYILCKVIRKKYIVCYISCANSYVKNILCAICVIFVSRFLSLLRLLNITIQLVFNSQTDNDSNRSTGWVTNRYRFKRIYRVGHKQIQIQTDLQGGSQTDTDSNRSIGWATTISHFHIF